MKITTDLLVAKGACAEGRAWFQARFGVQADYQVALEAAAKAGHIEWVRWALNAVGRSDDTLEVDGPSYTKAHLVAAGRLVVKGQLCISGSVLAGRGIEAGWGIEAGFSIRCKLSLSVNLRVFTGICIWRLPTVQEQVVECAALNGTLAYGTLRLREPSADPRSVPLGGRT
jgi:phage baseplate assembly protein gpV